MLINRVIELIANEYLWFFFSDKMLNPKVRRTPLIYIPTVCGVLCRTIIFYPYMLRF